MIERTIAPIFGVDPKSGAANQGKVCCPEWVQTCDSAIKDIEKLGVPCVMKLRTSMLLKLHCNL